MKVYGYRCPECNFYHDHTDAARVNDQLQVTCAYCDWREVIEVSEA